MEEKLVVISGGEIRYTVIAPKIRNASTTDVLQNFFEEVKKKTGVNLMTVMNDDGTEPADREIIIGSVSRTESKQIPLSYSGCFAQVTGEKIVVNAYSDTLLKKALTRLTIALTEDENGNWVIAKDFAYSYDDTGVTIAPPMYETQKGTLEGVIASGEGNYEISVKGTTEEEYRAYLAQMVKNGFTLYTENTIGNNLFGTYTASKNGSDTAVYTMYYPTTNTAKVIYGPKGYLPSLTAQAYPQNAVVTPTITQLGREQVYSGWNATAKRVDGAPGMGYVIQLADGSYILIDGGSADHTVTTLKKESGEWKEDETKTTQDAKNLYDFLVAHSPNGQKPVIAAWIITHAHGDHIGLPTQFLQTYKNDITLKMVIYNFPDYNSITLTDKSEGSLASCVSGFKAACNGLPAGARPTHFVAHSGQKIYFPGCEIEFLYTQEDYYPNQFESGNATSLVFRMTLEGASGNKTVFMVTGDADTNNSKEIAPRYKDELKCDILQLNHHGFNGACDGLYEYMNPDICLWACDPYRFDTDKRCLGTQKGYEFNAWIRENVDTHYTSETTVTIEIK